MSKAILVIDMPKSCADCPLAQNDSDYGLCCFEVGILYDNVRDYKNRRSDDCPLKPMPEKELDWNDGEDEYITGFNACIDEILGEQE